MKKFLWCLACLCILVFTSCLEMVEEVFLNQDGSGKYMITMDMSELFSDPMMKSLIEEAAKEEANTAADEELEMDSTMYFRDMPQYAELNQEEQALIKDVVINMMASESKEKMIIEMVFPFQHIDDFAKMGEAMSKMTEEGGTGAAGLMNTPGMGSQGAQFVLNKRTLSRLPMPDTKELMGQDENMEMMKMFFESATYTTIYHLPGKVKNTDIPNARVEGKTVTIENNLLDLIEGKIKIDGDIKFKKK